MGSNYQNSNAPVVYQTDFENELEHDISESWKSTLNFTGSNPVFPVEMFIALIEHKYAVHLTKKIKVDQTITCTGILSHICDDKMSPAAIWKKQLLCDTKLENLNWLDIKKDLLKHFGQQQTLPGSCYSMQERLLLFYSLMKSPDEKYSNFLVRVNIVASIVEHGKPSRQANQDWTRLFFLLGLSEEDRNMIIDEADFIYDLNGLCSLLVERRQTLKPCDNLEELKESINLSNSLEDSISNIVQEDNDSEMSNNGSSLGKIYSDEVSLQGCSKDDRIIESKQKVINEDANKTTDIKQELPGSNPMLIVEWENENGDTSMEPTHKKMRTKKRKKGMKDKHNLSKPYQSLSPKSSKTVGTRPVACVICNKNFDTVSEFKKHNLETHPADKPTKVYSYFLHALIEDKIHIYLINDYLLYIIIKFVSRLSPPFKSPNHIVHCYYNTQI